MYASNCAHPEVVAYLLKNGADPNSHKGDYPDDDVKEWFNEEIYILKRKAQDRDAWKMIFKCVL